MHSQIMMNYFKNEISRDFKMSSSFEVRIFLKIIGTEYNRVFIFCGFYF